MALLWVDGFEKYGPSGSTINPSDIITWKYLGLFDEHIDVVAGATTGNAIRIDNATSYMMTPSLKTAGDGSALICGFAFKLTTVNEHQWLMGFRQPNNYGDPAGLNMLGLQVSTVNSANEISLVVAGTDRETSNGVDLQDDTWYYLEMKATAHVSTGTCEVYLNQNKIIDYTGNTQYVTAAYPFFNRVLWRQSVAGQLHLDDLYICDDSGSTNNDVLGTCNVYAITPNADVSGNWTPNTGSDFYATLNEITQDANYISDSTTGNQVILELSDLPSALTIAGVAISVESQVNGNLNKYAKLLTQNGTGNIIEQANCMPGNTNHLCVAIPMDTDPDGNAWTSNTVNDLRVGVRVS